MTWIFGVIGFFIGFIMGPVGAVIGAIIGWFIGAGINDEEDIEEDIDYKELKLKVKQRALDCEDGNKRNFFVLSFDGVITVSYDNCDVEYIIEILDITDGGEKSVHVIDGNGVNNRLYIQKEETIPYKATSYDNIEIEHLLIDSLIFPRKGERKLTFLCTINDSSTGKSIKVLSKKRTYHCPTDGYEDLQDNAPRIEELAIKMAFYMCSADGNIDVQEGKVIANLGKLMLEDYPDNEQAKNKKRINGYISSAHKDAKNKELDIHSILNEVNEICDITLKNIMLEKCLDVAAADGVADKHELELAYYMAEQLELDKNEYTKMIEKKLPINIHNSEDASENLEKGLGITSGMSNQEIVNILKKEFKKWNQRVAHSDPSKREQAELMLHKISELRKKYKK